MNVWIEPEVWFNLDLDTLRPLLNCIDQGHRLISALPDNLHETPLYLDGSKSWKARLENLRAVDPAPRWLNLWVGNGPPRVFHPPPTRLLVRDLTQAVDLLSAKVEVVVENVDQDPCLVARLLLQFCTERLRAQLGDVTSSRVCSDLNQWKGDAATRSTAVLTFTTGGGATTAATMAIQLADRSKRMLAVLDSDCRWPGETCSQHPGERHQSRGTACKVVATLHPSSTQPSTWIGPDAAARAGHYVYTRRAMENYLPLAGLKSTSNQRAYNAYAALSSNAQRHYSFKKGLGKDLNKSAQSHDLGPPADQWLWSDPAVGTWWSEQLSGLPVQTAHDLVNQHFDPGIARRVWPRSQDLDHDARVDAYALADVLLQLL